MIQYRFEIFPLHFTRMDAAKAVMTLGNRLKVEIVKGDYIDVAERIHFGLHYDPADDQVDDGRRVGYPRPQGFPVLYHRISLSYPAHWLSDILTPLLEDTGALTTNVRPPCIVPLRPDHVDIKYPAKKLCIMPFVPELKTLATIFPLFFPSVSLQILSTPSTKLTNTHLISYH
jgi:hypothetical protein